MKEEVVVEKLVYGGYGLARLGKKVFLIEGAYPGEFVEIKVINKKKNTFFAKVEKIITPSENRVRAKCKHFRRCGGCDYLDFDYKEQLEWKRKILEEQLRRIGKIDIKVNEFVKSDEIFGYRNKMEYTFFVEENRVKLGMKRRKTNELTNIDECLLEPKEFFKIKERIIFAVETVGIPVYDFKKKIGVLKHLVLRKSFSKNESMSILVTKTEDIPDFYSFKKLLRNIPTDSIIHVMNSKDSVVLRGPYRTIRGEGVLTEEIDDFVFQIPPISFFQVNYSVTKKILGEIVQYFKKNDGGYPHLLDLYSGVGLFSIYFSYFFNKVTGVEVNKISTKAAVSNSHINNIKNTRFVNEDVQIFVEKAIKQDESYGTLIIDPPREGLGKDLAKKVAKLAEKRIIMLSCNPSTLARDLKEILEEGYEISYIKGFDMFPHTFHMETLVILEKFKGGK